MKKILLTLLLIPLLSFGQLSRTYSMGMLQYCPLNKLQNTIAQINNADGSEIKMLLQKQNGVPTIVFLKK